MRNFKPGDKVAYLDQVGTVTNINGPAPYFIEVSFDNGMEDCFTPEGLQVIDELNKNLTHAQMSLSMLACVLVFTAVWALACMLQADSYKRRYDNSFEDMRAYVEGYRRTRTGAIDSAFTCKPKPPIVFHQ